MELKEQIHTLREGGWSSEAFTAQELLDKMEDLQMPLILKVIDGYYGIQHIETFSSDQILWIYGKIEQKRIIGIDNEGNHISIPYDTPIRFENINATDEDIGPQNLTELLKENTFPVTVSIYTGDFSAKSIVGTELSAESVGNLSLTKNHTMTTFIGVCLQKDTIDEEIQNLPMYLNNKFKMATSKDEGSRLKFEELRDGMEKMINSVVDFKTYTGSSDIIIYEKADIMDEDINAPNYNALSPQKFTVKKKTVRRRSKNRHSSGTKARFSLSHMVASVRRLKPESRKSVMSMSSESELAAQSASLETSDSRHLINETHLDDSQQNAVYKAHTDKDFADGGKQAMQPKESNELKESHKPEEPKEPEASETDSRSTTASTQQSITIIKPKQDTKITLEREQEMKSDSNSPKGIEPPKKSLPTWATPASSNTASLVGELHHILKKKTESNDETEELVPKTNTEEKYELSLAKNEDLKEQSDKTNGKPQPQPRPAVATKPKVTPKETASKPTIATKPKVTPKPKPRQSAISKPQEDAKIDNNGNAIDSDKM
ncbi:uncharacterized protein LOC117101265 isoform X2 [Anneissia japonica]|nr:uncharacterized protein LOC117101265 isoform X2 [Anneissia japonica]